MSKTLLTLEDEYDFNLIGISCHTKDYRLCWELNNTLKIDLSRAEDLEITTKMKTTAYPFYEYNDEDNYLDYFLISNKNDAAFLIPEQKMIDFFLMIKGALTNHQEAELLEKINKLSLVLTSYKIDISTLKSKKNLLF